MTKIEKRERKQFVQPEPSWMGSRGSSAKRKWDKILVEVDRITETVDNLLPLQKSQLTFVPVEAGRIKNLSGFDAKSVRNAEVKLQILKKKMRSIEIPDLSEFDLPD